jgi:hypothetical protein
MARADVGRRRAGRLSRGVRAGRDGRRSRPRRCALAPDTSRCPGPRGGAVGRPRGGAPVRRRQPAPPGASRRGQAPWRPQAIGSRRPVCPRPVERRVRREAGTGAVRGGRTSAPPCRVGEQPTDRVLRGIAHRRFARHAPVLGLGPALLVERSHGRCSSGRVDTAHFRCLGRRHPLPQDGRDPGELGGRHADGERHELPLHGVHGVVVVTCGAQPQHRPADHVEPVGVEAAVGDRRGGDGHGGRERACEERADGGIDRHVLRVLLEYQPGPVRLLLRHGSNIWTTPDNAGAPGHPPTSRLGHDARDGPRGRCRRSGRDGPVGRAGGRGEVRTPRARRRSSSRPGWRRP